MKLYSASDTSIGVAFPAWRVNLAANETHKCSVKYKASAADGNGLYVRIYEYNAALPDGKIAISNSATNSLVQEDSSRSANWIENGAVDDDWITSDFTYTPHASAVWASIVVLNWTGMGTKSLYIRDPIHQLIGSSGSAGAQGAVGAQGAQGEQGAPGSDAEGSGRDQGACVI